MPVIDLFLNTKMNELIEDQILPGIKSRGLFNFDVVSKIWNKRENEFSKGDVKIYGCSFLSRLGHKLS